MKFDVYVCESNRCGKKYYAVENEESPLSCPYCDSATYWDKPVKSVDVEFAINGEKD